MVELTLQILRNGWVDVARFRADAKRGAAGRCHLEYDTEYVIDLLSQGEVRPQDGVAWAHPPDFAPTRFDRWPGFIDDIRPAGAARRWWCTRMGLRADDPAADWPLLAHASMAPVGNLRVKEAVPEHTHDIRFPKQVVLDREYEFLEYAAEHGACAGGATGAGGEAPKLVVRLSQDEQVWLDARQEEASPDRHYLVKFARNRRTALDRDILRAEAAYYRALRALNVDTIAVDGASLVEGAREPSLWLPRFDVEWLNGWPRRLGMESIYALVDAAPGSFLRHEDCLAALRSVLETNDDFDPLELTAEYLRRDMLNVVFGNSDNHGRNAAILKSPTGARLAPVFDFAPMKLDPEGIIRHTKWSAHEAGGAVDWVPLARSLGSASDADFLIDALRALAAELVDLPDLLASLGAPERVLDAPVLDLARTRDKLRAWGLL